MLIYIEPGGEAPGPSLFDILEREKMTTLPKGGDEHKAVDWLAWIDCAAGGGSWARGADRADTIRRCLRLFKADWSSLYDLGGAEVVVNVVDVTGHDRVTFGGRGVFIGNYGDVRLDRTIEQVRHVYPGKPKRRGKK
jgi:hypothetical protein